MHEIIRRVTTGDLQAFDAIVEAHEGAVFAFFAGNLSDHRTAEDLTQETFVAAYRSLASLQDAEKMGGWLLSIARNKLMTHLRQFYRSGGPVDTITLEIENDLIAETDRLDSCCNQEIVARLHDCVDRHEADDKTILHARYFNNEQVQDIASRLGMTAGALRIHLYRLRRQLRACMEGRLG
jgi:RNA polymerase sigma-70 factor (ECF subfamily)